MTGAAPRYPARPPNSGTQSGTIVPKDTVPKYSVGVNRLFWSASTGLKKGDGPSLANRGRMQGWMYREEISVLSHPNSEPSEGQLSRSTMSRGTVP